MKTGVIWPGQPDLEDHLPDFEGKARDRRASGCHDMLLLACAAYRERNDCRSRDRVQRLVDELIMQAGEAPADRRRGEV